MLTFANMNTFHLYIHVFISDSTIGRTSNHIYAKKIPHRLTISCFKSDNQYVVMWWINYVYISGDHFRTNQL